MRLIGTMRYRCLETEPTKTYDIDYEPVYNMLKERGHLPPDNKMYRSQEPLRYEANDEPTPWATECHCCGAVHHEDDVFDDPTSPGHDLCEYCFAWMAHEFLGEWEDAVAGMKWAVEAKFLNRLQPKHLRLIADLKDVFVEYHASYAALVISKGWTTS